LPFFESFKNHASKKLGKHFINHFYLIIYMKVKLVEKISVAPYLLQRVLQKWMWNLAFQPDIMSLRSPCNLTTSLKNKLTIRNISSTLKYGVKWAIF